ncbi:MAG TPA: hypothetical protein VGM54_09970 [Chthoniobacter sp.]|jgi:hypothetical protein
MKTIDRRGFLRLLGISSVFAFATKRSENRESGFNPVRPIFGVPSFHSRLPYFVCPLEGIVRIEFRRDHFARAVVIRNGKTRQFVLVAKDDYWTIDHEHAIERDLSLPDRMEIVISSSSRPVRQALS